MLGCGYGETYEPDDTAGLRVPAGWGQGARPLVIAPEFPVAVHGESGQEFSVKVLFIGERASRHASIFWESLRRAGEDIRRGLGEDRVLFDVLPMANEEWIQVTLPNPSSGDEVGSEGMLELEFVSPLFVRQQVGNGRRKPCLEPSFMELTRAGLRTLGPLYKLYGQSLLESTFREVKEAAMGVPRVSAEFTTFSQWKSSHRTKSRIPLQGVIGKATFGPVPDWLSEWIRQAGQLHVGTHRVAGAGGWRIRAFGSCSG